MSRPKPPPISPRNDQQQRESLRRRIMGLMKHFRSRSKLKDKEREKELQLQNCNDYYFPEVYMGPDNTARLDDKILRLIFQYVCPHSTDDSYDPSESLVFDGCMLCDLRDLANCAKVNRRWYPVASGLLYRHVRIDAVHYCELEEILTEKRKLRSRHHDPIDPPAERLQLLCRSVRENKYLAEAVRTLKIPYMTRESHKADLARTVSVLPDLQYVDLPDGVFTGDLTCHTLRQELMARCPRVRKMRYAEGSEQSLELLVHGHWPELQVLEISKLHIELPVLRAVLGMLPALSDLTFADLDWLNDSLFQSAAGIPEFPPLHVFTLNNVPNITAQGLVQYLSNNNNNNVLALQTLNLKDTAGITVEALQSVLWAATKLINLTYIATVSHSLPMNPLPPLASNSLQTMHYEVSSAPTNQASLYPPALSYYQYLTNSLLSNSLPALRQLYVRDPDFPEALTLAPPVRPFADSPQQPPRGFQQPLEVFTKGLDEIEWVFTAVTPADGYGRRGSLSGGRPLSAYSASKGLGPQWGGDARKSIVVGNGFGGFLAVPVDDEPKRPKSAGGSQSGSPPHSGGFRNSIFGGHGARERRGSRADLWR